MWKTTRKVLSVILCFAIILQMPYVTYALEDGVAQILQNSQQEEEAANFEAVGDNETSAPSDEQTVVDPPEEEKEDLKQEELEEAPDSSLVGDELPAEEQPKPVNLPELTSFPPQWRQAAAHLIVEYELSQEDVWQILRRYPLDSQWQELLEQVDALGMDRFEFTSSQDIWEALGKGYHIDELREVIIVTEVLEGSFKDLLPRLQIPAVSQEEPAMLKLQKAEIQGEPLEKEALDDNEEKQLMPETSLKPENSGDVHQQEEQQTEDSETKPTEEEPAPLEVPTEAGDDLVEKEAVAADTVEDGDDIDAVIPSEALGADEVDTAEQNNLTALEIALHQQSRKLSRALSAQKIREEEEGSSAFAYMDSDLFLKHYRVHLDEVMTEFGSSEVEEAEVFLIELLRAALELEEALLGLELSEDAQLPSFQSFAMAASSPVGQINNPLLSPLNVDYQGSFQAPVSIQRGQSEYVDLNAGTLRKTLSLLDMKGRGDSGITLNLLYDSANAELGQKDFTQKSYSAYVVFHYSFMRNYNTDQEIELFESMRYYYDEGSRNDDYDGIDTETIRDGDWYYYTQRNKLRGTVYLLTNKTNSGTDAEKRFALGAGWSLDIPYIHTKDKEKYLWLSPDTAYSLNNNLSFKDYTLTDISLVADTTYTSNGMKSAYRVNLKDGSKLYFGEKGQLISSMDRYENTTRYQYTTLNDFPVLSKITDSVGKEITFQYTGSGNEKTVTVTAPDGNSTILKLSELAGHTGKYALSSVSDPEGRKTSFTYDINTPKFTFMEDGGVSGVPNNAIASPVVSLKEITYPTGGKTQYSYTAQKEALGKYGYMEVYKLSKRQEQSNNLGDVSILNPVQYTYQSNTGYPNYYGTNLPTSYRYTTTRYKGTSGDFEQKTIYTFSNKHLTVQEEQKDGSDTLRQKTEYTYNSDKLRTGEKATRYADGNSAVLQQLYTYDKKANLLTTIGAKGEGDSANTEHRTAYTYHSTYNYPLTVTYKQDANTTIKEESIPTTDGKSVAWSKVYRNGVLQSQEQYRYDQYGNAVESIQYPDLNGSGISTHYSYDDNVENRNYHGVNLTKVWNVGVQDADGNNVGSNGRIEQQSWYDTMGRPTRVVDANGNEAITSYDKIGRTLVITNGRDRTAGYSYDDEANTVTYTDFNGNDFLHSYDQLGNLRSVQDVTAGITTESVTYDRFGRVATEQNAQGLSTSSTTRYRYDLYDRVVEKETSAGESSYLENMEYQDVLAGGGSKVILVKQADDETTRTTTEYTNKYGEKIQAGGVLQGDDTYTSTYYQYNYLGQTVAVQQYIGQTKSTITSYELDYQGNVLKEYDIDQNYVQTVYDAVGRATAQTDKKGNTTHNVYDHMGRLIRVEKPFHGSVRAEELYYYDSLGNMTMHKVANEAEEAAQPSYKITEYRYDEVSKLTDVIQYVTDTQRQYTHYEYDLMGNTTAVFTGLTQPYNENLSAADYAVNRSVYDSQGREIQTVDALGQSALYTYDANGYLIQTTDRNGNTTANTYDFMGRILSVQVRTPEGTLLSQKESDYNAGGELLAIREGEDSYILYSYDDLGRVIQEIEPGRVVKAYTYDNRNNRTSLQVTKVAAAAIKTTYTYDRQNRLSTVSENGTVVATYAYDLNGNRASLTENNGVTTTYSYNDANLVTSLTNNRGGVTLSAYSYTYYLDGNQHTKADSDGVITTYVYDRLGRLQSEETSDGNLYTYTYDPFNNRATLAVAGEESYTTVYSYDKNNRLLQESKSTPAAVQISEYSYDPNGNQLLRAGAELRQAEGTSSAGPNVHITTASPSDLNATVMTYDGFNRLVAAENAAGVSRYGYRPDNLRRYKNVNGNRIDQVWAGQNLVLEAEHSTGSIIRAYVRGINLLYSVQGAEKSYYLFNAHGDVVQLTDQAGMVTHSYRYDAFGNELAPDSEDTNPMRYCGEYLDFETGTYYLRARYYDPVAGRFTQADTHWNPANSIYGDSPLRINERQSDDPLGLNTYTLVPSMAAITQSSNLYAYAGNNPVLYVDPSGQVFMLVAGGVLAVGGVLIGGGIKVAQNLNAGRDWHDGVGKAALIGGAIGGIVGLTGGAAASLIATAGSAGGMTALASTATVKAALFGTAAGVATAAGSASGTGYATFQRLKDAVGSAGSGYQWHHIVEQSQIAKSGFSTYIINNTQNIIRISNEVHAKISGYYSSIDRTLSTTMKVRNWLAGQDFQTQYQFGIEVLKRFGVIK